MARLIDYDEFKWQLTHWRDNKGWSHQIDKMVFNLMELDEAMEKTPTVDIDVITESHEKIGYDKGFRDGYAQAMSEVKHGHWVMSDSDYEWECSSCGYGYTDYRTTYCYDCGAKMDEVTDDG